MSTTLNKPIPFIGVDLRMERPTRATRRARSVPSASPLTEPSTEQSENYQTNSSE
jgi:hypothetical protein